MINSALAYVAAAITAVVLIISGIAVASDDTAAPDVAAEPVSTTTPPASSPTTIETTLAPVPVAVPALGGMNPSAAVALVRDAGLEATTSEVDAVVGYAIGAVVASEPPEGTALLPGETVNIIVGRRPEAPLVDRATPLPWDAIDWVDAVDRTVGRCSIGRQDGVGLFLDAADCAGPHDFQFLGEVPLEVAPQDDQAAANEVWEKCLVLFETFVGADYGSSALYMSTLTPTADSWNQGSRSGECLIAPPSPTQQLVGDAAGSLW